VIERALAIEGAVLELALVDVAVRVDVAPGPVRPPFQEFPAVARTVRPGVSAAASELAFFEIALVHLARMGGEAAAAIELAVGEFALVGSAVPLEAAVALQPAVENRAVIAAAVRREGIGFAGRGMEKRRRREQADQEAEDHTALSRIVTNSSATVGWMPIVASNCALVAPSFTAMAMPWITSPASRPIMW